MCRAPPQSASCVNVMGRHGKPPFPRIARAFRNINCLVSVEFELINNSAHLNPGMHYGFWARNGCYLRSPCSQSFPWTMKHPQASPAGGIHFDYKPQRDLFSMNLSRCLLNPCKQLLSTTCCSKESRSSALPHGESPLLLWNCPFICCLFFHNFTPLHCLMVLSCLAFSSCSQSPISSLPGDLWTFVNLTRYFCL